MLAECIGKLTKFSIVECLADTARINGTHSVVSLTLDFAFHTGPHAVCSNYVQI